MSKSKNNNKSIRRGMSLTITLAAVLLFAAAATIAMYFILSGIKDEYVAAGARDKQAYCDQLADTLAYLGLGENGDVEQVMHDYIRDEVPASGDDWPFLYSNSTVIYAKDENSTKTLQKDEAGMENLLSSLNAEGAVVSSTSFTVDGRMYVMGFLTAEDKFFENAGLNEYRVYILVLFGGILLISVMMVVATMARWSKRDRDAQNLDRELKDRNEVMEKLEQRVTNEGAIATTDVADRLEGGRFRQYKFKFYLNARHAIYIGGRLGAIHPHTWEISLNVIKNSDDFIEFHKLEKEIEKFMSKYQDKTLNDVEPFDAVNPTLENCCNYFKNELSRILAEQDWKLLMMEMSETPSRSYVISLVDEKDA